MDRHRRTLDSLKSEIQNDREFLYSRLMEIDDAVTVKKNMAAMMEAFKDEIRSEV